jgi:hypothetical protein
MRTFALALASLVLLTAAAAASPEGALADGGPSPGVVAGWDGVLAPSGAVRYVALIGGPTTTLAVVRVGGGRVVRSSWLRGGYGVPLVAYDGTAGGVSADGSTLVLSSFASGRLAAGVSRFVVVATKSLRTVRSVVLRGAYSFDAVSPDGSTLYLIQYLSDRDFTEYRVRAYDVASGRLYRGAIVDRRESDEQMHGFPVTRASTRDGAWAYTLYGRENENAFVHALDTRHREARCVDLPWKVGRGLGVKLRLEGRRLVLVRRGSGARLGAVDTRTFAVTRA